ncbi:hypothetical protein Tco_1359956 [Tanacetum coccineum]
MSDSEDSTVTCTEVSSPFEHLSDIGSPRVIVHGHDGLPMMPEDPYAYVEAAMQEPPPPDFVPEPVYPEFMPPDDVLPAEEQPLPTVVSPIADSPEYIANSSSSSSADVPEVMLPPQNRLCIASGPRYEVGECSSAPTARLTGGFRADYGFVGTLDGEIRRDPDREIGYGITNV